MNTARFLSELGYALGDPSNAIYSANANTNAMYRAIREYSRWRPLKKAIGMATLYAATAIGDTTMQLLGGPFVIGNVLNVDIIGIGIPEVVTVTAIAMTNDSTDGIGAPQTVTVAPLAHAHAVGCIVVNQITGITTVSGQSTYALPYDLISLDQESFGLATGQRSAVKKYERFYDAATWFSNALGGVGFGQSQTFTGYGSGSGGYAAFPFGPGNSIVLPGPGGTEAIFSITMGDPPALTIAPTPSAGWVLDPVYYWGQHTPATVPDADMDALLCYAQWAALMSRIAAVPTYAAVSDGKQSVSAAAGLTALMARADGAMSEWKRRISDFPFITSG